MFTPATAITAGALVFALGGAFLIAQPFNQQAIAPGAEAETISPTWITGTIQAAPSCSSPTLEIVGDVRRERIAECSPQIWTADDPRLTGEVVRRWNTDVYSTDEGWVTVDADTAYLRNDAGTWVCTSNSLLSGSGSNAEIVGGPAYTFHCTGDGGHAGLSAVLVSEIGAGFNEEFVGLMFAGEFPPQPEPPAAE